MLSIPDFTNAFPEFDNENTFPGSRVLFWLNIAESMVNEQRWGKLYCYGIYLLTAHYLVLDARRRNSVRAGGLPGETTGVDSGQSADVESYSVDVGVVTLSDAGSYNATEYGITFWQLAKMRGTGPLSALSGRHGCYR